MLGSFGTAFDAYIKGSFQKICSDRYFKKLAIEPSFISFIKLL